MNNQDNLTKLAVMSEKLLQMDKALELQATMYNKTIDGFEKKIDELHNEMNQIKLETQNNISVKGLWIASLGIIGVVLAVVQLFIKH